MRSVVRNVHRIRVASLEVLPAEGCDLFSYCGDDAAHVTVSSLKGDVTHFQSTLEEILEKLGGQGGL